LQKGEEEPAESYYFFAFDAGDVFADLFSNVDHRFVLSK
jgi:hypothetical protein